MKVSELRKAAEHLQVDLPVYCSTNCRKDIVRNPDRYSDSYELSPTEGMFTYPVWNKSDPPMLSEVLKLPDDKTMDIDIEDGFIYRDVKQIIFLGDRVVLTTVQEQE